MSLRTWGRTNEIRRTGTLAVVPLVSAQRSAPGIPYGAHVQAFHSGTKRLLAQRKGRWGAGKEEEEEEEE
eukprot:CAMPEP_0174293730 /NCGR_PEP_ID=MMETSP0809-20121228/39534_1 /TAXON_ID=73025 ORGANISM="Eutreptiella gymnastica-like, Strain CCMP1594" /NCGR_SAMPLE_ID=MMETSP0809 /ASSEMBLY_ACC=CAM_ASM_000658 /LENGTH=69 /DNA_ID=CAMNT_0015394733 /DNA_START=294 /DNA_END=500 /DNA_ORIENTATION=+